MTTNPYERAVIEAARRFTEPDDLLAWDALAKAVDALDAYEASLTPGVKEIPWHEVTEGDELQGSDGTTFRPVLRALKVRGGKYEITVQLNTGPKTLVRPTKEAPSATVRRGAAGQAVDVFVNVFSSGGR
jgi:hypothetical protein